MSIAWSSDSYSDCHSRYLPKFAMQVSAMTSHKTLHIFGQLLEFEKIIKAEPKISKLRILLKIKKD